MEKEGESCITKTESEALLNDQTIEQNATVLSHSMLSLVVPKIEYVQGSIKEIT